MATQEQVTSTIVATARDRSVKSATNRSQFFQSLAVLLTFAAIVTVSSVKSIRPEYAWLISMLLLIVFTAILGLWIVKDPLGILISNRNVMGMSRLQTAVWTVIVVPAFMTLVLYRIRNGVANPLSVSIPMELWAAMGISLASLVGTPLILGSKSDQSPSGIALKNTSNALGTSVDDIADQALGTVFSNPSPRDARVSDMFQGDEVGNKATVDLAKVQMFAFTLSLILAYGAGVWALLASLPGASGDNLAKSSAGLPALTKDSVYLLLISHAGYLTSKAVNHTDQDKTS